MNDFVLGEPIVSELSEPEVAQDYATPGASLAFHRKAMGWSVEQVAAQLKLAPRQIQFIEADDYASLPGMASVRGFIRAYAKLVKIEAGPLVAMISSEAHTEKGGPPARRELSAPFFDTRLPTKNQRIFSLYSLCMVLLVVGLALVLSAQLFGWFPPAWKAEALKLIDAGPPVVPAPKAFVVPVAPAAIAPAAVAPAPAPIVSGTEAPAAAVGATPEKPIEVVPALPAPIAPIAAVSAAAPIAQVPSSSIVPTEPESALVLKFRQDSWIELRRANGTVVATRLMKAGTQETFPVTGPMQLLVGNVAGVDAALRGAALELKPAVGNTIRLNLK